MIVVAFLSVVCVQFLSKFTRRMKENGIDSSVNEIELELLKVCKEATDKEERFVSTT